MTEILPIHSHDRTVDPPATHFLSAEVRQVLAAAIYVGVANSLKGRDAILSHDAEQAQRRVGYYVSTHEFMSGMSGAIRLFIEKLSDAAASSNSMVEFFARFPTEDDPADRIEFSVTVYP